MTNSVRVHSESAEQSKEYDLFRDSKTAPRDDRPDDLDQAKGPRASEETVDTREETPESERRDEVTTTMFQGVHRDHERHCAKSIPSDRHTCSPLTR